MASSASRLSLACSSSSSVPYHPPPCLLLPLPLHQISLSSFNPLPSFQSLAFLHLASPPAAPLFPRPPNFSCCAHPRRKSAALQKHEQQEPQDHQQQQPQQHVPSSTLKDDSDRRKRSGFRLQGRLRLLLRSVRRWYPNVLLQACLRYVRAHLRQVAILIVMGFTVAVGCLCLKLSSISAPHIVAYSELVRHLHAGTVTSALFEEGSRRVFFNVKPENEQSLSDSLVTQSESGVDKQLPEQGDVERGDVGRKSVASLLTIFLKGLTNKPEQLLKSQPHPWKFSTRRIENDETYLLNLMRESGITYSSAPQPTSLAVRTILITMLTLWIPLSPLLWLMHRQFSGGNAQAQKRRLSNQSVRFADVAGVDEAKLELMEVVSCLRGATNFRKLGAKLPKGVLLVGPPGTGKTLLARAVAGEAAVPFFAASASEFVEMFVGRGAARVRELFSGARKCAPSIIFIDELDAVGGRRGRSFNDERDQTLNQLLTEMDGFDPETGVLVIAATNRPEALDPALCRPGRFSRKVFVREPDLKGREQILAVHMRGIPIEGDAEVVRNMVASITWGFVGADLANVVNEAALLAVRQGRSLVVLEDFKAAVMRVKFGVGDKPTFSQVAEREIGRLFNLFQPKTLKSVQESAPAALGYETAPWSG